MSRLLLTMDRGDREQLLNHCKWQVSRFVTSFDEHLIVDYPAKNNQPDLRDRVKYGYDHAVSKGYDWITVIENDDYFKNDYLHRVTQQINNADFVGSEFSIYFNLRNRTWERTQHPNHSSLFCTSFRVSAMQNFKWHLANKVFLDIDIWNYARRFRRAFTDLPAIGIKHGIGLCGGKGHKQTMPNKDPNLDWLKSKVDETSYEFYSKLELK